MDKTKVLFIDKNNHEEYFGITLEEEMAEVVKESKYFGALITNHYDDTKEIRRRIAIAKNATISLNKIWKDKSISKNTKVRLLRSVVFPIATYGDRGDRARILELEMKRVIELEY